MVCLRQPWIDHKGGMVGKERMCGFGTEVCQGMMVERGIEKLSYVVVDVCYLRWGVCDGPVEMQSDFPLLMLDLLCHPASQDIRGQGGFIIGFLADFLLLTCCLLLL